MKLLMERADDEPELLVTLMADPLWDKWVRVGGMKMLADGSISERTAWVSRPYVDRPSDFGIQVMTEQELYENGRKAHEADWQIGVHANGDRAIDVVLRVYERLQRERPRRDPRFRLEHCTIVNDSLIKRIKTLGAIPTPFAAYVYYHGEKFREYGAERLNQMFALRSFLDAGIRAAPGSDYPPGPFEPMMALQSAVTRTDSNGNVWGQKQRISVEGRDSDRLDTAEDRGACVGRAEPGIDPAVDCEHEYGRAELWPFDQFV